MSIVRTEVIEQFSFPLRFRLQIMSQVLFVGHATENRFARGHAVLSEDHGTERKAIAEPCEQLTRVLFDRSKVCVLLNAVLDSVSEFVSE